MYVREALNYMPHDGDIVMVSHLKCGNNWLEQIIQLILYSGESAGDLTEYHRRTPYIEMVGTGPVKNMRPPRFFKTHFTYERQPMNTKARYVYLTRNPLDVCVSFYHFTRSLPVYRFRDGAFDDFFELFVTGKNDRGDFFDHFMSWYSHKDDSNVFFVTYEELKRNFKDTVLRLARFLAEEYARPLETDEELFQKDIDGVKYSLGYKVDLVREALSYVPHDGDIVMVSPLKCGNNWLEQIMQLILYRGQSANDLTDYHKRTPYIEMVGTGPLKDMHPPRFFKTHFSYERQPMNPKAKYVYLTRNPLDVCVSFYHFTRSVSVYRFRDGTFDDFFELFVTGQNDRGDFFDHLMSWYPHKDDANVFFVTYEELKRNFRDTVLRLARFLGEEYAKPLESKELFQKVVEQSSLSFMSQFLMFTEEKIEKLVEKGDKDMLEAANRFACEGSEWFLNKSVLVRKGIVGDWKTLFKEEHLEQLRLRIHEKNVAPALKALWSSEDLGGVV
ncbi:hypothetical protein HPB47_007947 [Ixodes persulcatus]|uniref:Uncharacterized protein n=1 Tax=Ixodes persulcatus TaxID=34615 RepID=A0AC60P5Z9_IXOPE|nr:hypothetical protein HPB47_007947 [Ixodes persulcatus]